MPVEPFLTEIAQIALEAAASYGVALGGGTALVLHGVVDRPTQDVDLFAVGGVPFSTQCPAVTPR